MQKKRSQPYSKLKWTLFQWSLFIGVWGFLTQVQCRTLMWFDSGELALAVHSTGMGHPPGQPLFTALGKLISFLPGSSLFWLNHLSVLATLGQMTALWKIFEWSRIKVHSESLFPSQLFGSLALLYFYPIWDQGTRIEVYALANCLGLWSLAWMIRFWVLHSLFQDETQVEDELKKIQKDHLKTLKKRALRNTGLCLGGCGAVNPIFALMFGFAQLGYGIYKLAKMYKESINLKLYRLKYFRGHLGLYGIWSGSILGSFGLSYLYWITVHYQEMHFVSPQNNALTSSNSILSAFNSLPFVWGDPYSWTQAKDYFLGADYQSNGQGNSAQIIPHLIEWCVWAYEYSFFFPSLIGGIFLVKYMPKIHQLEFLIKATFLISVVIGSLFSLSYTLYWPEVPDFSAYFLPSLSLSILGGMYGVEKLNDALNTFLSPSFFRQKREFILGLSFFALLLIFTPPHLKTTRASHHLPLSLATDFLESLPPKSFLFVESDHWVFPLLYAHHHLQIRPDVIVFNTGFYRSRWYWRWIFRSHPALKKMNLDQIQPGNLLNHLVQNHPQYSVYTESLALLRFFKSTQAPCAARWGISLNCRHPIAFPSDKLLKEWALHPSHQDPITRKVLASLGWKLSLHAWMQHQPEMALKLGYASLGRSLPHDLLTSQTNSSIQWWPAPPQLWKQTGQILIGSPEILKELLIQLARFPQSSKRQEK